MAGFCAQCGTAREDGADSCSNCGHSFAASPGGTVDKAADANEPPSRPNWLKTKWIGAGLGAIALVSVGGWLMSGNGGFLGLTSSPSNAVDITLLPVSFGGKCGYVDATGKMVINPQFDNALAFNSKTHVAPVVVGGKWGLIDREGKYVVNPQFDDMNINGPNNNIIVTLAGKQGTIDSTGKFVINPQFDSIGIFDTDGYSVAQVGKKYGVIDATGKYILSPEYDDITADWASFRDGHLKILDGPLLVSQQGKYGFVDKSGKLVIQPQFSAAAPFDASGLAAAAIEEVDTDAFERTRNQNADAVTGLIRERLWQFVLGDIRRDGLRLSFDVNNYTMTEQIRVWLIQNVKQGQWNVASNEARDAQGFVTKASIVLTQILEAPKRNKYGYIDRTGKFVISPQFADAGSFTGSNLAPVRIGTAFGYVDTKGKVAINPQWRVAGPFKQVNGEWLAVVGISEEGSDKIKYGSIDSKGAYKINPQFDGLEGFGGTGFSIAQSGELLGAVDTAGHYVLQPVYTMLFPVRGTSNFVFVKPIAGAKDMQEIGVIDSKGTVITTVRGGVCGGIYSYN